MAAEFEWMLDVLVDMEAFAERNQMPGSARSLRDAYCVVRHEISTTVLKDPSFDAIPLDAAGTEDADRLIYPISR